MFNKKMKLKIETLKKEYLKGLERERKLKSELGALTVVKSEHEFLESLLNKYEYEVIGVEFNKRNIKQYICIQSFASDELFTVYLKNEKRPHLSPRCFAKIIRGVGEHNKIICKIQDIFAEEENVGNGSILLQYLIKYVKKLGAWEIQGWLSPVDIESFNKLEKFYKKAGFTVKYNDNKTEGSIFMKLDS